MSMICLVTSWRLNSAGRNLRLPAVYESKHPFPIKTNVARKGTRKIWKDPRQEGEPLWPEKYSIEALERMHRQVRALTSHMAAGQLQQRPSAREGGLFKRSWFDNPVKFVPDKSRLQIVRSWDLASTEQGKTGD